MGYFPFFVELKGKRGLIVGGGIVAERKVRKLLPYEPELLVVAPQKKERRYVGTYFIRAGF